MALILLSFAAWADQDAVGECTANSGWFTDITESTGLRAYGNGLGVNFNDFDADGHLDAFVAMGPSRVEHAEYLSGEDLLYLADETGLHFTESGRAWGLDDSCEDRAPLFGDLDNDGLPDVYITVNGRNLLMHNEGTTFRDITAEAGDAGHKGWGHSGLLLDYDHDGFLDIFFTNGPEDGSGQSVLLHNQGDGAFLDVSAPAGVAGSPSGKGACVLDADLDGWMDIFVTTGREYGNQLYINQGDGTFVDQAHRFGLSDPEQRFGVGTVCEDMDNDGDPDIMLVTHDRAWTGNQLFRNDRGTFADVAPAAGVADLIDGHGLALVDVDNDGLLDIVMSGIRTPPHLFHNLGDLRFERMCDGAGIQQDEGVTWAVNAADLSGDGYPEVYISNGLGRRPRGASLFLNAGGANHYLVVEARATTHNPSAIGAKVELLLDAGQPTERTLTRWVGTFSAFDSQGPLPLSFGLGATEVVSELRVTFTNGHTEILRDVPADQQVEVVEPSSRTDADFDGVPDEWDVCPGTRQGQRHDAEGCAVGQRDGVGLALSSPPQDAVLSVAPVFRWTGEMKSSVLQISVDGTFGPVGRFDFGPFTAPEDQSVSEQGAQLTEAQWAEILAASDGSRPLLWRVVAADDEGGEAITDPQRFYGAQPSTVVHIPEGANVFEPAHIVVPLNTPITWWNDTVSAGNLQEEPHDVQLIDSEGVVVSPMSALNAGDTFTYTFTEPGTWHYLCQRHSGHAHHEDGLSETTGAVLADGPYRCMSGTVVAR